MQAGIPVKVYHSDVREHDSLFIQHQDVVNKGEVAVFDKVLRDAKIALEYEQNGEKKQRNSRRNTDKITI